MIKDLFKNKDSYRIEQGKYIFQKLEFSDISDVFDKVKSIFKKYPKFYYFLINLISPMMENKKVDDFLEKYVNEETIALNIGSGNSQISKHVYNVDIFAYDNVDVVCDIADLPFKDNSVDVVLNLVVLEHVPNPQQVMAEMHRVLKPDGIIYTAIPFIQGFHASPYDFTRLTEEGIKVLHKDFQQIDLRPFGGPTSGLLCILQEYIAILFSFGNKKIHLFIHLLSMLLTFPLKFLDYFLIHHPMAKNIAAGFVYIGKK